MQALGRTYRRFARHVEKAADDIIFSEDAFDLDAFMATAVADMDIVLRDLPGDAESQCQALRALFAVRIDPTIGQMLGKMPTMHSRLNVNTRVVKTGNNNSYRLLYDLADGAIHNIRVRHFDKAYQ